MVPAGVNGSDTMLVVLIEKHLRTTRTKIALVRRLSTAAVMWEQSGHGTIERSAHASGT